MNQTAITRIPRWLPALCLCMVLSSCQPTGRPRDSATASPGPALDIGPATRLSESLVLLRGQLDSARTTGLDDTGTRNLNRAEAISDRLLETRLPFAWISAESYSLEARLRQIQSRADRVESLRIGGARREDVLAEIGHLVEAVDSLRADIARGGSQAPPPVDQLLVRMDTARR
jgi:hypothetical protein